MAVTIHNAEGEPVGGDALFENTYMRPFVDQLGGWVTDADTGEIIYTSPTRQALIGQND